MLVLFICNMHHIMGWSITEANICTENKTLSCHVCRAYQICRACLTPDSWKDGGTYVYIYIHMHLYMYVYTHSYSTPCTCIIHYMYIPISEHVYIKQRKNEEHIYIHGYNVLYYMQALLPTNMHNIFNVLWRVFGSNIGYWLAANRWPTGQPPATTRPSTSRQPPPSRVPMFVYRRATVR